jgi:hypothetical protein
MSAEVLEIVAPHFTPLPGCALWLSLTGYGDSKTASCRRTCARVARPLIY